LTIVNIVIKLLVRFEIKSKPKQRRVNMCHFFSLVSNGDGKPLYFDARIRREIIRGKTKYVNPDSHTSIADYFGYKGEKEDKLNKYEYNPLTKVFTIDQKNNPKDDSDEIEAFCKSLDFKKVVPELILKPIIHPFKDIQTLKVTPEDLKLLKKWASVSVKTSVRDSVWASVGASVWDPVWDSVWDSVVDSVRVSVGASVWDSVWDSVWTSVWDSVWSYISSFFDIGENPFQSAIDLWNRGLVPSFDGIYWRLHGKDGKIIWKEGF